MIRKWEQADPEFLWDKMLEEKPNMQKRIIKLRFQMPECHISCHFDDWEHAESSIKAKCSVNHGSLY